MTRFDTRVAWIVLVAANLVLIAPARAQVIKETIPGVTNFSRVGTTIACAGATTPAALTEIKRLGFAAVINLRQASEQGADIEAETAAAKVAGLRFIHLPFNAASPDPMLVERFIAAVTAPANQPAFIHCASGNRVAALWLIKRVEVDKWDVDRASAEAAALGLTSPALKAFALEHIQKTQK